MRALILVVGASLALVACTTRDEDANCNNGSYHSMNQDCWNLMDTSIYEYPEGQDNNTMDGNAELSLKDYKRFKYAVEDRPWLKSVVNEAMRDGKVTYGEVYHVHEVNIKHKQAIEDEKAKDEKAKILDEVKL
jgi:hypothetical protein